MMNKTEKIHEKGWKKDDQKERKSPSHIHDNKRKKEKHVCMRIIICKHL